MLVWKGAAPGSHWHTNDATRGGFFGPPGVGGPTPSAALLHVTLGSSPSPFISFSTSYDVAHTYATLGGTVSGGYVYEVDTTLVSGVNVFNPVQLISTLGSVNHQHDGSQHLIVGIADAALAASLGVFTRPPLRFGGLASLGAGPSVTTDLTGLIRAIRDAEILLGTPVPGGCIRGRHLV